MLKYFFVGGNKMIGYVLKILRIVNNNITLKEVSLKTGLSASHISEIENGMLKPSDKMLDVFGLVYNISPQMIKVFASRAKEYNLSYKEMLKMIVDYYFSRSEEYLLREKNCLLKIKKR